MGGQCDVAELRETHASLVEDRLGDTNVQTLAALYSGSCILRGIMRNRLLHPHASPYVGSLVAPETGTGY